MQIKHITRAEWVAALRSGKYKQAKGSLKENGAFCCLGVACDLAGLDWDLMSHSQRESSSFAVRVDNAPVDYAGLPYPVLSLFIDLGLTDMDTTDLANQNDRGDSFEAIADEIEKTSMREVESDWLERWFPSAAKANARAVHVRR